MNSSRTAAFHVRKVETPMSSKSAIFVLGRYPCSFRFQKESSDPHILEESATQTIWLEYEETEPKGKPKTQLCILSAVEIQTVFLTELQAATPNEIESKPQVFTADVERKNHPPMEFPSGLSNGAEQRLLQITAMIRERAEKLATNLRWRLDLEGAGKAFRNAASFFWSEDRKTWQPIPRPMFGELEIPRGLRGRSVTEEIRKFVVQSEGLEPVSHSLFRDAWYQRRQDLKASLMQGVCALEVGVKHCIAQLVPNAEFLIMEMPSPPVHTLLGTYLPELLRKMERSVPQIPEAVLESVKKMVHQRNRLIHKGELSVDRSKVNEFLGNIHDILYYLDFLTGNDWALSLTSREFKDQIQQGFPPLDLNDPLA
jgi:hypothetical protein